MQDLHLLVLFRGAERLLIELGGLTTIVMGTLLYRWGVRSPQQVEASGSGFSFALKNAAPGSVLALFGMTVLVVGLMRPLDISTLRETGVSPATSYGTEPAGKKETVSVNYASLADRVGQELDRLATLPELPNDRARETLQDRKCAAVGFLTSENLSPELTQFFQQVRDAAVSGEPAATLVQLSAQARQVKLTLPKLGSQ